VGALEELNRSLVLLGGGAGGESPEIAAFSSPWILLERIEAVFA
jgi:hypothetical protein